MGQDDGDIYHIPNMIIFLYIKQSMHPRNSKYMRLAEIFDMTFLKRIILSKSVVTDLFLATDSLSNMKTAVELSLKIKK